MSTRPGRSTNNRYAAKYRNRSDQQSARKQWSGVARGLKFVISVQGNDWERFLYLAACQQQFGGHVGSHPPRFSAFVEGFFLFCHQCFVFSTPAVASIPVLLSQHDLTRAFSQALQESLPRLVAALQGHVHSTNSWAEESVSSATTASGPSVVTSLGSLSAGESSGIAAVPSFISNYRTLGIPPPFRHLCLVPAGVLRKRRPKT